MRGGIAVRLGVYWILGAGVATGLALGSAQARSSSSTWPEIAKHKRRVQVGIASWYGPKNAGKRTASGVPFDPHKLTAAHRTLPFHSRVRVTNLANGRSVDVTINDRGPGIPGRAIDLSERAAATLKMKTRGLAHVRIVPLPSRGRELADNSGSPP
jgi:peptidoglycan lytic transglycosylase